MKDRYIPIETLNISVLNSLKGGITMANKRQRKNKMKKLAQMEQQQLKLLEITPVNKVLPVAELKLIEIPDDEKPWLNPVIIDSGLEPPSPALYLGKYEAEQYQKVLNQVYTGTVKPIERFINPHSILLHHCSECHKEFYAKPLWLG